MIKLNSEIHTIVVNKVTPDSMRTELIKKIRNSDTTDFNIVSDLCNELFHLSNKVIVNRRKHLYCALALKEYILMRNNNSSDTSSKSSKNNNNNSSNTLYYTTNNIEMKRLDILFLARGHYQYWLIANMTQASRYHLDRSKVLYSHYIQQYSKYITFIELIEYSKILMCLGETIEAEMMIDNALHKYSSNNKNEIDHQLTDYLLIAGALSKSNRNYEKASNLFFESKECGPPTYFDKIEMMIVISRNLEELQESMIKDTPRNQMNIDRDNNNNNNNNNMMMKMDELKLDNSQDAYKIVHQHLVQEGHLDDDSTVYDEWISKCHTWLQIGDKCALHHIYSLASDFYSLSILKDPNAFEKPSLWYRYAKSCYRCGKLSDAQLAIIQALSTNPLNSQLLHANRNLSRQDNSNNYTTTTTTSDFEYLIQNGMLPTILDMIPLEIPPLDRFVIKIQALLRGYLERKDFFNRLGYNNHVLEKSQIKPYKMSAKVGVVFEITKKEDENGNNNVENINKNNDSDYNGSDNNDNYVSTSTVILFPKSFIIIARCSWSGTVSYLYAYDVDMDVMIKIKLREPFSPIRITGDSTRMNLSISCLKTQDSNKVDLYLRFDDPITGYYCYRIMRLVLFESINNSINSCITIDNNNTIHNSSSKNNYSYNLQLYDFSTIECRNIIRLPINYRLEEIIALKFNVINPPVINNITNTATNNTTNTTTISSSHVNVISSVQALSTNTSTIPSTFITNAKVIEVVKQGFRWNSKYYQVRMINDRELSKVSLNDVYADVCFILI